MPAGPAAGKLPVAGRRDDLAQVVLIAVKNRKHDPTPKQPRKPPEPDAAFDAWLQQGLHQLFDGIANEPIPEELLRIIEDDKKK